LALAAGLAVAEMWTGLALSYVVPNVPPSFGILATATAVYAATFIPGLSLDHRVDQKLEALFTRH
jgi:zinc/manganese transport system permease protein